MKVVLDQYGSLEQSHSRCSKSHHTAVRSKCEDQRFRTMSERDNANGNVMQRKTLVEKVYGASWGTKVCGVNTQVKQVKPSSNSDTAVPAAIKELQYVPTRWLDSHQHTLCRKCQQWSELLGHAKHKQSHSEQRMGQLKDQLLAMEKKYLLKEQECITLHNLLAQAMWERQQELALLQRKIELHRNEEHQSQTKISELSGKVHLAKSEKQQLEELLNALNNMALRWLQMLSRLVKGSQVVDLINKQYDEWQNGARAKGKVEDDGSDVQTKRTLVQTRRKLVSELTESRKENIDVSNRHATFLEMGYSQQSSYLKQQASEKHLVCKAYPYAGEDYYRVILSQAAQIEERWADGTG